MTDFHHVPVMRDEVIAWIAPVPAGRIVDATLGGAGHAIAILDSRSDLTLLGLDRDLSAVAAATRRLVRFESRVVVRHARFDEMGAALDQVDGGREGSPALASAVLFDLGASSHQLDSGERGFSFRQDAPLDMRMDQSTGLTASDVVNEARPDELATILREYGDEKFAARIARAIVARRPISTTVELAEIITSAIPAATRRVGGHPAKRSFQALRIHVNDELSVLRSALDTAIDRLRPGGRCIVLSYHSGEDRIVKDRFVFAATGGCTCPVGLPCNCGALPRGRRLRNGVIRPSATEIAANPRAASALARVFEKGPDSRSHNPRTWHGPGGPA